MFFASHGECLLSCDMVVSAVLGGVGERGWGGVGLSDSCFPSALSQAVATLLRGSEGATQRSESQRYAWAKILPIRRSSQFVLSYPRCLSGVSGPLGVMHKNTKPEVNGLLLPYGSDYAFSSLFPVFSPQLYWVLLLCLVCVGSAPSACFRF